MIIWCHMNPVPVRFNPVQKPVQISRCIRVIGNKQRRKKNCWFVFAARYRNRRWTVTDNRIKGEQHETDLLKLISSNNLQIRRRFEKKQRTTKCTNRLWMNRRKKQQLVNQINANFCLNYYVSFAYRANERSKWTTERRKKPNGAK